VTPGQYFPSSLLSETWAAEDDEVVVELEMKELSVSSGGSPRTHTWLRSFEIFAIVFPLWQYIRFYVVWPKPQTI
jgi:hypothetical protein